MSRGASTRVAPIRSESGAPRWRAGFTLPQSSLARVRTRSLRASGAPPPPRSPRTPGLAESKPAQDPQPTFIAFEITANPSVAASRFPTTFW
jgi:hypothetical protein